MKCFGFVVSRVVPYGEYLLASKCKDDDRIELVSRLLARFCWGPSFALSLRHNLKHTGN